MAYTFNGLLREIYLDPGTRTLDVLDLYSRWKEWVAIADNAKYPLAFLSVGGNPIDQGAGTFIPGYIYILNGWHIHADMADHTLAVVGGILLRDGGGDPFETIPGYTIRINYQQPVQAIQISSGSGLSASQAAQLLELYRIHGLEAGTPLQVSQAARTAGAITQQISEAGGVVTLERQ